MKRLLDSSDRGMTLIELLVYSILSLLVLSIVGGLLISSLNAQGVVTDSSASTNGGALVADSVATGVRSSIDLRAVPGDPSILLVHRLDDALATPPTTHCEAWYFGDGEVRTTRYAASSAVAPATDSMVPAWIEGKAGAFSNWILLGTDATLTADSSGTPVPVFVATGTTQVEVALQMSVGRGSTVLVETTAVSRQKVPTGVTERCF
ncbi:PilW family protein [Homoserinimonas sp. A520]